MIAIFDTLAQALPIWSKISLWAILCAIVSMFLYRKLSPQQKLYELKQAQKISRSQLRGYDGDMSGLYRLIGTDLKISLKHMGLVLPPTLIAIIPVIYIVLELADYYKERVLPWHYEWIGSTEILFFLVMIPMSLLIKVIFKIH